MCTLPTSLHTCCGLSDKTNKKSCCKLSRPKATPPTHFIPLRFPSFLHPHLPPPYLAAWRRCGQERYNEYEENKEQGHTQIHTTHTRTPHVQHTNTHRGLRGQGHASCDLGLSCGRRVAGERKEEARGRAEEARQRFHDGQKMTSQHQTRYNDLLHYSLLVSLPLWCYLLLPRGVNKKRGSSSYRQKHTRWDSVCKWINDGCRFDAWFELKSQTQSHHQQIHFLQWT